MSINFSQFPVPTLPIQPGDFVVGYQLQGTGGVPTLAQYSMLQLFSGVFPGGVVPISQGGTGQTTQVAAANALVFTPGGTFTGPVNATTQARIDNSTLVATDNFVNQQIASSTATVPFPVVGGIYNQASLGSGASLVALASGGVVTSVITVANPGSGYAVGDLLLLVGGNDDAVIRVTSVSGGGIVTASVIYGGSAYSTGATLLASDVPPGQRTVTLTGVLTSNVTFIIQNGTRLTASRRVEFNNNTTGAFTVTVFLSNGAGGTTGSGVVLPQGTNNSSAVMVQTDGVTDVWLSNTPLGIGAAATSGTLAQFASTTSAQLAGVISDETGTGSLVFQTTPTLNQPNIVGTTTNNNATAGSVGELLTNNTLTTSASSGVTLNATSVSLTAGDWDVTGIVQTNPAGTTTTSIIIAGVSTASATLQTIVAGLNNNNSLTSAIPAGFGTSLSAPVTRISLAATTTVFLVAQVTFAASTMTVSGFIRARRIR